MTGSSGIRFTELSYGDRVTVTGAITELSYGDRCNNPQTTLPTATSRISHEDTKMLRCWLDQRAISGASRSHPPKKQLSYTHRLRISRPRPSGWPALGMDLPMACASWCMGVGDDRRGRPGS